MISDLQFAIACLIGLVGGMLMAIVDRLFTRYLERRRRKRIHDAARLS